MRTIVCFGEALIDFLAAPGHAPDSPDLPFLRHAGGAPANVAVALATLQVPAAFAGMLGADMFGDFLLHSLERAGVATRFVRRTDAAKTALAFVALDERGERSFSFYRPPAADLLFAPSDFDAACFEGLGAFHACSNSLCGSPSAEATLEGMRRARAAGAIVSFDLNLRPALWPAGADPLPLLWQALSLADLVKLSAEELDYLAQAEGSAGAVRERLWRGHAAVLVVTDGPAPCSWHTRAAHGTQPVPSVAAVDTTGAGDAFVAGLLASLLEADVRPATLAAHFHDDAARRATLGFAAACGAVAVGRHGAFAAMPARSDLTPDLLALSHEHA
jgi:fructokinase